MFFLEWLKKFEKIVTSSSCVVRICNSNYLRATLIVNVIELDRLHFLLLYSICFDKRSQIVESYKLHAVGPQNYRCRALQRNAYRSVNYEIDLFYILVSLPWGWSVHAIVVLKRKLSPLRHLLVWPHATAMRSLWHMETMPKNMNICRNF